MHHGGTFVGRLWTIFNLYVALVVPGGWRRHDIPLNHWFHPPTPYPAFSPLPLAKSARQQGEQRRLKNHLQWLKKTLLPFDQLFNKKMIPILNQAKIRGLKSLHHHDLFDFSFTLVVVSRPQYQGFLFVKVKSTWNMAVHKISHLLGGHEMHMARVWYRVSSCFVSFWPESVERRRDGSSTNVICIQNRRLLIG